MGSALRVVVVDDQRINLIGTKAVLEEIPGVEVLGCLDFEAAMCRETWSDTDWVVLDVAFRDSEDDRLPSIPLIEQIRQLTAPSRSPMVVAVTGDDEVMNKSLIRARIIEADPDVGLIWRKDLETFAAQAIDGTAFGSELAALPAVDAPVEFEHLGLNDKSRLSKAVKGAQKILRTVGEKTEGELLRDRAHLAGEAGIEPVTKYRVRPANSQTPSLRQLRNITEEGDLSPPS